MSICVIVYTACSTGYKRHKKSVMTAIVFNMITQCYILILKGMTHPCFWYYCITVNKLEKGESLTDGR